MIKLLSLCRLQCPYSHFLKISRKSAEKIPTAPYTLSNAFFTFNLLFIHIHIGLYNSDSPLFRHKKRLKPLMSKDFSPYADNRTRTCTVSQWHLKPPRLPIPPYPQTAEIILISADYISFSLAPKSGASANSATPA